MLHYENIIIWDWPTLGMWHAATGGIGQGRHDCQGWDWPTLGMWHAAKGAGHLDSAPCVMVLGA
eukprot:889191-Pelagomonas_calceolata.AAC.3